MKTMKKVLALVMVLSMVAVLFAAAPMAYAAGGVSMSASGEGSTVTLTVTTNDALTLGGIHLTFDVPDGFTLQSSSYPSGLTLTAGTDDYLLETTGKVELPAGAVVFTAVYAASDELDAGIYNFVVDVIEAYGPAPDFDDYDDVLGTGASAYYEVIDPEAPYASPESGELEADTPIYFYCDTPDAEIYYSTDGGKTWTKGDNYNFTEDVEIQLKSVLNGRESEIVTYTYTLKVETTPEPTQPVESQPVESQPVESQPVESQPVESQPVESQPVESQPAESQPAESQPVESTAPTTAPTQKPVNPNNPTTGDESHLVLYVMIMAATLALGAVTVIVIRKGNKA